MSRPKNHWRGIKNLIVRGGMCHARVVMNGKEHWRSLHIEAEAEGRNREAVVEALRVFKLQLAHDHFAILQLTRSRNETSTFAQVEEAYRAACAGRDISETTMQRNIDWLGVLVKETQGEFFDVATGRTSLLNLDLLRAFQEQRIAKVKARAKADEWTTEQLEQKLKSAKNTAKSAIQQARSLFAQDLLQSRHYRDLILPDLTAFLKFRAEGSTVAAFVRPPAEVWQKILADVPALKQENLAGWFAFQLGVNCGLRRGSAKNARWAWCKEISAAAGELPEVELEVRRAKGGHYALRLPAGLWAELKEARASTDYIIPRATEEERDETIDGLVDWLRARGLDGRNPFHMLRKIFGNAIVQEHGLTEGQNALGHSKADLTHGVYAEHRATKGVRVV